MRFLTLFGCFFLISCGGGEGSNGPVSFNQQTDVSNQTSNSNNDDDSDNNVSSQSSIEIIKENRFGECVFGECKFE